MQVKRSRNIFFTVVLPGNSRHIWLYYKGVFTQIKCKQQQVNAHNIK